MTVGEVVQQAIVHGGAPSGRAAVDRSERALHVECRGVTHDSRRAKQGWIFVALRGLKADGVDFAPSAIAAGAAAVVAEREPQAPSPVPWIVVSDARVALAWMAAEFFGHPSRQMRVVGITGTNGKTTTSYLVSSIFE